MAPFSWVRQSSSRAEKVDGTDDLRRLLVARTPPAEECVVALYARA